MYVDSFSLLQVFKNKLNLTFKIIKGKIETLSLLKTGTTYLKVASERASSSSIFVSCTMLGSGWGPMTISSVCWSISPPPASVTVSVVVTTKKIWYLWVTTHLIVWFWRLTFLGLHFFNFVLGVVVTAPILPRDVIHIETRRLGCPRLVFCRKSKYTFVLFDVFVRRYATVALGCTFGARDSSQLDEVLTRDATNSCCFRYPQSEGCTQDAYILMWCGDTLQIFYWMTGAQFYFLTIPTRLIDENKQNGRIFFKDRQAMVAH